MSMQSDRIPRPSDFEIPVRIKYNNSSSKSQKQLINKARKAQFKGYDYDNYPYINQNGQLGTNEYNSCTAAGQFIWRNGSNGPEVLMAFHDREYQGKSQRLLEFPGGKRIDIQEEPIITAAREAQEETGQLMSDETQNQLRDKNDKTVVWIPQRLQAIFIHELINNSDQSIAEEFNKSQMQGKKEDGLSIEDKSLGFKRQLYWVQSIDLIKNRDYNFHPHTRKIIETLIMLDSLPDAFRKFHLNIMKKFKGTVKWFDNNKGFGFITPAVGGKDIFVHQSVIHAKGFRSLDANMSVEYILETDPSDRLKARYVTGPNGDVIVASQDISGLD